MADSVRIDFLLGYLLEFWERVPTVASEIDSWDRYDQLDYLLEDAVTWQFLWDELQRYQKEFSQEQYARFVKLQELIGRNKEILDKIPV